MSTSFIESNGYNNSVYTQMSDESFIKMDQELKDEIEFNNLLGSQEVPELNDTLDEINFILELGNKLNLEGKLGTPDCKRQVNASCSTNGITNSFITVKPSKSLEETTQYLNNTQGMSGVSYLINESEILELQKFKKSPKGFNDTTKFEDNSETAYFSQMSEDFQKDSISDTVLIEDSFRLLDDTQQTSNDIYFNSFLSEHGSEGEQSEDDNYIEESEQHESTVDSSDISEIDLTDDSIIEILDESN
ncbi:unnamed protein product [Chironomus riparius]|uniref:Uncharacterized protein n=1 Tax=Chironomus riparius TaxID=315576 RepID=A0A9P0JEX5_9DIPT|nr:unnamed protein product [Chironomus riparius]